MLITENEIVAMIQENAALCNLEAEVIVALKAYEYNEQDILRQQINQIISALNTVDAVRKQYSKEDE